ncbi:MAG: hypothetical protein J2P15_00425 [Micromonosporaceae bacterium]|nr:hypothetical protein [Micromonosporaceae bacterium]
MGGGDVQVNPMDVYNYGNKLARDGAAPLASLGDPIRSIVENTMNAFSATPGGAVSPLPEGISVQQVVERNLTETQGFLGDLTKGLTAMQSAATAMAVVYATTDNDSALGLNAIDFAFGNTAAGAPPGFPQNGWSTMEQQAEQDAAASGQNTMAASMTNQDPSTIAQLATQAQPVPGGGMQYTFADGSMLVVSYPYVGNPEWGGRATTYSVYKNSSDSKPVQVQSSGSGTDGSMQTFDTQSQQTTDAQGNTVTSTTTVTHLNNGDVQVTTSNTDAKGNTTSNTQTVHPSNTGSGDSGNAPFVQQLENNLGTKGDKQYWGDYGMT